MKGRVKKNRDRGERDLRGCSRETKSGKRADKEDRVRRREKKTEDREEREKRGSEGSVSSVCRFFAQTNALAHRTNDLFSSSLRVDRSQVKVYAILGDV